MSAIAGFIGSQGSLVPGQLLEEMLRSTSRNGLVDLKMASFEAVGLQLGWLATSGPTNDCVLSVDKERDVSLLLRGDVCEDGGTDWVSGKAEGDRHTFTSPLRQFSKLGLSGFEKLNGCFGGVLVDTPNNAVVLFNDRYGLGRLYYHEGPNGFYFASEAKALLKVLGHLRQLDLRSLGEFLSCDCVLQDRTIFRDIFILPAASAWTFRPNRAVEKRRYFDPADWEDQVQLSPLDYYDALKDTFPTVLPRYLRHPAGVAMSLTGGLDGRLIMAWSRPEPGQMPCYTFGSCFGETADVRIANRIASLCGQPFTELQLDETFLSQFPELAQEAILVSDGTMDVTGAAELFVNRLARSIRPVRLTGNYGSEILRGHVAFRPRRIFESPFDRDLIQAARQAQTTYAEESRGNRRSFIAFKQVPWHHFARSAVEKSQLTVRSPYLDNELVALSFQAPEADQTNFDICLKLVADGNSELAAIPTDRGVCFGANTLLNRWRESKERFLARAEYAYDYGMPNWLAQVDRWLSLFQLERVFLGRQKFCHFRTWYRASLASYVKEILLDSRSLGRPYLRRREVEQMVAHHVQGRGNFTTEIHKLLTLELTQRLLLEGM